ncbi:putative reverse transcriptase domain-containing protein, partial [Tanacetum coccineum]
MDLQRVDLLMGDRMTLQETVWMEEEEAYASREAWAHSDRIESGTHQEFQTISTLIQTQHQVHETRFQMQQAELAALRETAELLALREQQRRARQPGPEARIPDHQDASGDADNESWHLRNTTPNNTNPNNMTPESIQAMIDQALLRNSTNGDGSHSSHGDNRRNVQTARPCFYADFMKCQPLNFKGTEGVVKFATCTLLGAALTWWNGQIRTLGPEAYAMTWEVLKKKMTDKYCPQGEIKKLEIELWNLKVKGNDVPAYTERFQELTLICTKFVANKTEKVDKYISGLPDNIYGNVKSARPKTLDETIELANDLMDQKLRTYTDRSIGNTNIANTHKGNGAAPKGNGCFECGSLGYFKRDCPKLKNKDGGNGNAQGWVYAVGNASGNPDSNVVM